VINAQHGNGGKPNQGDGAKEFANACGASFLHGKQAKQNDQGEGDHRLFKGRGDNFQTFYGRQHRDGGGDHTIAIKQTGAKDSHQQKHFAQLGFVFDRLRGQCQHGHQATLAMIVCTQHQSDVFERDNGGERPKENGQNAVHIVWREVHMARAKNLFQGIQDAGSNVAVDDTDGAQGQGAERSFGRGHKKSAQHQGWAFIQNVGDFAPVLAS
jgi:hypothetical protein